MGTKTGRPPVGDQAGTQVGTTLPPSFLEEVDQYAAEDGVTRAEMLRTLIFHGAATRRATVKPAADRTTSERAYKDLLPAIDLIATWIAVDPEQIRSRFLRYSKDANYGKSLVKLLLDAAAEIGRGPGANLVARLDGNDWRLRGQLFFAVVEELHRRGVRIPGRGPGDPPDPDDDLLRETDAEGDEENQS